MLADKKRSGDTVEVILPEDLGKCRTESMNETSLLAFMKEGCGE